MRDSITDQPRRLVFISHANPQDNDVALWLASKLTCAGYLVWSDLTSLFGGDVFWEEIEDAIREHTVKFLPLVSVHAQSTPGVLDEVAVALSVERNEGIKRFVVPLRVDSIPYDRFRANIGRKNAIDFSSDWASALEELVTVLERDGVPKVAEVGPSNVAAWLRERSASSYTVVQEKQRLASNWLKIEALPPWLFFSRAPKSESLTRSLAQELPYPVFVYAGMYGSFAASHELQPGMPQWFGLTHGHRVDTHSFLSGQATVLPRIQWQDAHNLLSSLLREAWDRSMTDRGLKSFQMSNRIRAWFYPADAGGPTRVGFTDLDGRTKSRQLVGRSKRREAYWHYAVSIRPAIGSTCRLIARAHVIFTRDGETPIYSSKQMLRLRRGYCRNWWNDRWRSLLIAFFSKLAAGDDSVKLAVAPGMNVEISAFPIRFECPVTVMCSPSSGSPHDQEELDEDEQDLDALLDHVELSSESETFDLVAEDIEPEEDADG